MFAEFVAGRVRGVEAVRGVVFNYVGGGRGEVG